MSKRSAALLLLALLLTAWLAPSLRSLRIEVDDVDFLPSDGEVQASERVGEAYSMLG